jgi:hypothetical protein
MQSTVIHDSNDKVEFVREWPVRWELLACEPTSYLAAQPDFQTRPELAAHRQLDKLGALTIASARGSAEALEKFAKAIDAMILRAPKLAEQTRLSKHYRDASNDDYGCKHAGTQLETSLINWTGVNSIIAAAFRARGKTGADTVRELCLTALEAETLFSVAIEKGSESSVADTQPVALLEGDELDRLNSLLVRAETLRVRAAPSSARCFQLLDQLMLDIGQSSPQPPARLTWIDGISSVEVIEPCSNNPKLVIHGSGFGAVQPGNVGVIAPFLDFETKFLIYRQIPVTSWSDTRVEIAPSSGVISGSLSFADSHFLSEYELWAMSANRTINIQMQGEGCPGYNSARPTEVWPSYYPVAPSPSPMTSYQLGRPNISIEIYRDPISVPAKYWDSNSVHMNAGDAFNVIWKTSNALLAILRPVNAAAAQVLAASGFPDTGIVGTSGQARLVSPGRAQILEFALTAASTSCGTTNKPLRVVVTGSALKPAEVKVFQGLAGGDVDVLNNEGIETLSGGAADSIPLVAEKRTVVQIDWWLAIPQIPVGEQVFAVAELEVTNHSAWPSLSGILKPGQSTAEDPPTSSVTLYSGPPFDTIDAYNQWIQANNNPQTFNVVVPAEWCKWESTFTATITVFSPGQLAWTVKASKRVKFHRRRRVRIRYRRHTIPGQQPPTTDAALQAIRNAASLLPIPDPEISVLGNDPAAPSNGYIEDMFAERGGAPTPQWRDEIWLVVGPVGVGGFADISRWPWIAATDATGLTTAHEIYHMFNQNHLNLCNLTDGDDPTTFPNGGNVPVTGWDMWNNAVVRNARDIMVRTYCPEPTWISPERWRRVFLQVGPG